jgi:outer membrane protein OmpA-like peptidoglycan-associated protein
MKRLNHSKLPGKTIFVALTTSIFGLISLTAQDVVTAEKFLKVFGVPEQEMNRLISIEAPPTVAITIHFDTDSTEIKGSHNTEQLKQLGLALQSPELAKRVFSVEGHTDKRGEASYNLALSQRRSKAVVDYLIAQFRVEEHQLEANGQGEYFLLDEGDSDEAHAKNRRVAIVLNGSVAE